MTAPELIAVPVDLCDPAMTANIPVNKGTTKIVTEPTKATGIWFNFDPAVPWHISLLAGLNYRAPFIDAKFELPPRAAMQSEIELGKRTDLERAAPLQCIRVDADQVF